MPTFLSGEALWAEIARRARKAHRLHVVVGYLGLQPVLSRWPADSLLIADLSEDAVRSGSSSARGALRLPKHVQVRSLPNLHAKVYLFDSSAIVASANLSLNSREGLIEAGTLLTSPRDVRQVERFVEEQRRRSDPMPAELLKVRAAIEPRRRGRPRLHAPERLTQPPARAWVLPAGEITERTKAEDKFFSKFAKSCGYDDRDLSWYTDCTPALDRISEGDWVFYWSAIGRRREVIEGPYKALGKPIKTGHRKNLPLRPLRTAVALVDDDRRGVLSKLGYKPSQPHDSARDIRKVPDVGRLLKQLRISRLRRR